MLRSKRQRPGQAALEYVLVVMICAAIFGFLFWAVRITVYDVWVCYMGPRIQSPGGCTNTQDCYDGLKALAGVVPAYSTAIDTQKNTCDNVYNF